MGVTISLNRAFEIVKDRFGTELAEKGAADEEVKKYLADLAQIDNHDYFNATRLWREMKLDISRICAQMQRNEVQDMFVACLDDYKRAGIEDVTECVKTKDETYRRCLEDKKEYDDKIAGVEASMGSWDENSISLYDLDNIRLGSLSVYYFSISVPEALAPFHSQIVDTLRSEL